MIEKISYVQARELLAEHVVPVETESVSLEQSVGRILAEDFFASQSVPPFDRSPYDGYAVRGEDTVYATCESPVELAILEEVPSGSIPSKTVKAGTAVKILTGAPIPAGADTVVMYEQTEFTQNMVKIFAPLKSGSNIVRAGEDVVQGQLLARLGVVIDVGLVGMLASQGVAYPRVFRRPCVSLISTGSEIREVGDSLGAGMIFNSNRYTIQAILNRIGCDVVYLGIAPDHTEAIAERISRGIALSDAVVLTGGVSAGDYDLTPSAMEQAGVELLARNVRMKPGMACAYGVKDGKLICGLSGNPAAAIANLSMVVLPALKKLCGVSSSVPSEISLTLVQPFEKSSRGTRMLFGRLTLERGQAYMELPLAQGNTILSGLVGCDVIAVVPAGSGPLEKGTTLKGYRI